MDSSWGVLPWWSVSVFYSLLIHSSIGSRALLDLNSLNRETPRSTDPYTVWVPHRRVLTFRLVYDIFESAFGSILFKISLAFSLLWSSLVTMETMSLAWVSKCWLYRDFCVCLFSFFLTHAHTVSFLFLLHYTLSAAPSNKWYWTVKSLPFHKAKCWDTSVFLFMFVLETEVAFLVVLLLLRVWPYSNHIWG